MFDENLFVFGACDNDCFRACSGGISASGSSSGPNCDNEPGPEERYHPPLATRVCEFGTTARGGQLRRAWRSRHVQGRTLRGGATASFLQTNDAEAGRNECSDYHQDRARSLAEPGKRG